MGFQPVPAGAQVAVKFLQDNQIVENVFAFDFGAADGPLSQLTADAVADEVEQWIVQDLQEYQVSTVSWRETSIHDLSQEDGATFVYTGDGSPGRYPGGPLPNEVTFSVKKNVLGGGSDHGGRFYHIGLGVNAVTQNAVHNTELNGLVSTYNSLRVRLLSLSFPLVVVSRRENNLLRPAGLLYIVQSVSVADPIVDSQRRRGPGRGR